MFVKLNQNVDQYYNKCLLVCEALFKETSNAFSNWEENEKVLKRSVSRLFQRFEITFNLPEGEYSDLLRAEHDLQAEEG